MPRLISFSITIFLIILVSLIYTQGAVSVASELPPQITFTESSYDFGNIEEGEVVIHNFVLKNTGGSTLVLERVKTSCGCTAALPQNREIAPGDTTSIRVSFDSHNRTGEKVHKTVTVYSNDPEHPQAYLFITGSVVTPVNDPPVIDPACDDFAALEDTADSFDLTIYGSDVDDRDLIWTLDPNSVDTTLFTAEVTNNRLTITPLPNQHGQDDVTLILTDPNGNQAAKTDVTVVISKITANLDKVPVYPNPFRPGRDTTVKFLGLSAGATIRIYNIAGDLVRIEKDITTDPIEWDGRNDNGRPVASGIYFYLITDKNGEKIAGKIALIRE